MATKIPLDFDHLEETLVSLYRAGMSRLARAQPETVFYAVALWGVHRERDGHLSLPTLGTNPVAAGAPSDDQGFWGPRWNPGDWAFSVVPVDQDTAASLSLALAAEATRGSLAHWDHTLALYRARLVSVAQRLADTLPEEIPVIDDFVVFWHDTEGGPELAEQTIPADRFARLFRPQVEKRQAAARVAALPPQERAAVLVGRFGQYTGITSEDAQRGLLELGPTAEPALCATLTHPKHGWIAAKLLGQLGAASPEAIAALRRGAPASAWFAKALGMIGDVDWLRTQGDPSVAAQGLVAPLLAVTGPGASPRALDYAPLAGWLATVDAPGVALVEAALKPGRTFAAITVDDVAEALRGLGAAHAVIRWHAASVLGDRSLGEEIAQRMLPALAEVLTDPHPVVRRLAALSLGRWQDQAAPYRPALEARVDDPDLLVRKAVARALSR